MLPAETILDDTPPKVPSNKYGAHHRTRWQRQREAAARRGSFSDFPADPKCVGQWILGECVGNGSSGRVRIAKHRCTGQLAAVKILPVYPPVASNVPSAAQLARSDKQRRAIDKEVILMKLMDHPNILRLYDVFQGDRELYLVLEYVEGGELFDFIVNRGRLHPLDTLAFFQQIIHGLNYAHTFSIFHRDLKPENILIHSLSPLLIKIADWGMATFAPPASYLNTSCGSPHYASPEVISGAQYQGSAADVWSCGVILYTLLTGRLPFDDKSIGGLLIKVRTGKYEIPPYLDPLARDMLARMLVVNADNRITLPEIMAHPWFNMLTPGILYEPVPSVFELAQPLSSEEHIKQDLLESLCVLWWNHGTADSIKADLLSPPGCGMLAKAFYFLLQRHRERTSRDNGVFAKVEEPPPSLRSEVVTKRYTSPTIYRSPPQPVCYPEACQSSPKTLSPHRSARSRVRPPAPIGPRIPGTSPSSFAAPACTGHRRDRRTAPASFGPSPTEAGPHNTHSPPISPNHDIGDRPTCHVLVDEQTCSPMPAAGMQSSVVPNATTPSPSMRYLVQPVGAADAPALFVPSGAIHGDIPAFTAPASRITGYTVNQVDTSLTRPSDLHAHALHSRDDSHADSSVLVSSQADSPSHGYTEKDDARYWRGDGNKENIDPRDSQSVQHSSDRARGSGGLFTRLEGSRARKGQQKSRQGHRGRDEGEHESNKGKGKRPRSLVLDAGRVSGSKRPMPDHPPQVTQPTIISPAPTPPVGEFKGWVSHLFQRKAHAHVLYSTASLRATQEETARILERLGAVVTLKEAVQEDSGQSAYSGGMRHATGIGILQCEMAASAHGSHVRFRVEFATSTCQAHGLGIDVPASAPPAECSPLRLDSPGNFSSAVVLTQEKGSGSAFKAMCQQLRGAWTLDAIIPTTTSLVAAELPSSTPRMSAEHMDE
ncbi:hypothetical protein ID866_2711 [Astraeus odoratus]|nr:hypothetical protein ID866_2711 [Astraeus odoratus]